MKDTKKRDSIIVLCIVIVVIAIPLFVYNHYINERNANEKAIANDRIEIRNLKKKRKQKIDKIYKRKENIKQLNERLHQDTNLLLNSQRVLLEAQVHKVDPEKTDKAATDLSKVTAQNLSLTNDLLFDYGKKKLTIDASYPSQFKIGQDQIPIIIHAYDQDHKEIAFAVVYYDPNEHVFNQVDNYSVSRQTQHKQAKGQGTDYQSYLKQKRAAAKHKAEAKEKAKKEAAERARKQAEAQAKAHSKSKKRKVK